MSVTLFKVLSIVFAFVGIASIVVLLLNRILQPQDAREILVGKVGSVCLFILIAIILLLFLGPQRLGLSIRPNVWTGLLLGLTLITSLVPHGAVRLKRHLERADRARSDDDFLRSFQSQMKSAQSEVELRASQQRSFTAQEAIGLLNSLRQWDLRYRSLPNYMPEAISILKRAINANLLDPNAKDENNDPLYLAYYLPIFELATSTRTPIDSSDFAIFETLLENGADLSLSDSRGRRIQDILELKPAIRD